MVVVVTTHQLVKDTRTEVETSNLQDVLDGDLDDFVSAYLRQFKNQGKLGADARN